MLLCQKDIDRRLDIMDVCKIWLNVKVNYVLNNSITEYYRYYVKKIPFKKMNNATYIHNVII